MQMEKGKLKRLEEKKKRDTERKQEEELRKYAEAEQRKLQDLMIAKTTVVSPPTQIGWQGQFIYNSHLLNMMQGVWQWMIKLCLRLFVNIVSFSLDSY